MAQPNSKHGPLHKSEDLPVLRSQAGPVLKSESEGRQPVTAIVTKALRADRVDSHLVMNVLNQMAARDFSSNGEENPLLFALSDYLREAFQHIDDTWLNLNHESKILDSHLKLLAAVNHAAIHLTVDLHSQSLLHISHGCLVRIAACVMKAAFPRTGGNWRMYVAVGGDSEADGGFTLTTELRSLVRTHELREKDARESVENLRNDISNPLVLRSAKWTQDDPRHLRLVCRIPGFTDSQ